METWLVMFSITYSLILYIIINLEYFTKSNNAINNSFDVIEDNNTNIINTSSFYNIIKQGGTYYQCWP